MANGSTAGRLALLALAAAAGGCEPKPLPPARPPAPAVTKQWKEFSTTVFGFKANFPLNPPVPRPFLAGHLMDGLQEVEDFSTDLWDNEKKANAHGFGVTAARLRRNPSKRHRDEAVAEFFSLRRHVPPGMKPSEPTAVTWAGRPAKEIVCEVEDATKAKYRRVVLRLLETESCLYVGGVRVGDGLTPAEVAKFFDGFQLLPVAGAE